MDYLKNIINKEKYQVFVFSCPASIPIQFARHTWFVVNDNGVLSRYEILHTKNLLSKQDGFIKIGYFYKNVFLPFQGTFKLFPIKNLFWKANLLGYIEGLEGETAQKIAQFIEDSKETYPYKNTYNLFGPNSNTYTNWILKNFPEFKIKLPWNAFGKNYKII